MRTIEDMFQMGMDRNIPDLISHNGKGIVRLNLGAGNKTLPIEAINLDLPEWDANKNPIPAANASVHEVYAFHFLEHLLNPIAMLKEIERVLMPGGVVNILVSYHKSQMAYHDLNHQSHNFCEETWRTLFSTPYYDTDCKGEPWRFAIGTNIIIGVSERNLALMTQLVKICK